MSLMPMKMYMLKCMYECNTFTIDEIMEKMRPVYGNERQFKYNNFFHSFSGMRSSGLIDWVEAFQKEDGVVDSRYKITNSGVKLLEKNK